MNYNYNSTNDRLSRTIIIPLMDYNNQKFILHPWFAVQKEKQLPGLAAHAIYSISTGKLEGFNNKIKVAKRIGYGYRDDDFFFTLIRYLSIPYVRSPSHKKS